MRDPRPLVVAAMAITLVAASAESVRRTFDQDAVGAPPAGFTFAAARLPAAGPWLVRADGTNRYLVHPSTASPTEGFSLAVLDAMTPADLRL